MAKGSPWFTLPPEDEKALLALVETHGIGRVLAVLSRIQAPMDREARGNATLLDPNSGN
jgi:hypothetical protein